MSAPSIYNQLVEAAQTVGWTEDLTLSDQLFLKSLLKAVSKTSNDVWDKLSNRSKTWFNDAADANNVRNTTVLLPIPEGYIERDAPAVAKQEEAKKAIPVPIPTKAKATKVSGVIDAIRRALVTHQDWNNHQIHEFVQQNGFPALKLDTVQVNAGDVRKTIAVIKELGFWKEPEKQESVDVNQTETGTSTPNSEQAQT